MDCESSVTLTAFAEGRLDGRKRGRVETHLPGCARCRLALERIENARSTLRAMSEWTPPQVTAASNARLEATLRWTRIDSLVDTTQRPRFAEWTPRRIARYATYATAAAAAIALAVGGWRVLRHRDSQPAPVEIVRAAPTPAVTPPPPPPPTVVPIETREAVVTLVGGDVRLVALDGSEQALDPRRTLHEGDHIVTGSDGRLAFQWGEGSGALLESGAELRLTRLLPRSQEMALARGRISVRVGPHQPGESMRVRSPDHVVTVHGTWFIVGVQPKGTSVEVLEGVVEVSSAAGDAASTRLPAPSRANFHRGSGIADDNHALTGREASALRTRGEMGLLAWSSIPALLEGNGLMHIASDPPAQLVVDGVPFGASPLDVLRPRGRHLVELSRAGFETVRKWISVGDGPAAAEVRTELREHALEPAGPSAETIEQEFGSILQARRNHIRHCYERAQKRDPNLAGTVTLNFSIGPAGQVLRTRITNDTLADPVVTECVQREVAGWVFPTVRNAEASYPFAFQRQ